MKFQEISDKQWQTIQKHLPPLARTGRPRCDDRTTINGIMFVLITGCRWERCQKDTAANRLYTSNCKTGRKKESGRIFCLMQ